MRGQDQGTLPSRFLGAYPLALCCGALALFALMAIAGCFMAGPQIEVDEGSYLLTAATLAGKLSASGVNGYYSGYSFLLLPAFLAGSDPSRIYHGALLVNALLVATTPFALFRLTRALLPEIASKWHAGIAIATTCYASLLLISLHAMSESALVPLYAWLLATGAEAAIHARKASALWCGVAAGLLFLVHPRGGLMAVAVLVVLSAFCVPRRDLRGALAALWIGALAIAALHVPLEAFAGKPPTLGSAYSASSVLHRLLEPSAWRWIELNAFGSFTEALVSSIGLVAIALAGLGMTLIADARAARWTPRTGVVAAIVVGFGVALLMSATFFIPAQRADHIAYGRYALPATIPLVAIGLAQLTLDSGNRARNALLAIGTGIVAITVLGLAFAHLPSSTTKVWNYVNVPMLYIAQLGMEMLEDTQNAWWRIGTCFVAIGGIFYAVAAASRAAAIATYAALNLAIAAVGCVEVAVPGARVATENRDVVAASDAFESVTGTPLCADLSQELQDDAWIAIDLRWRTLNALSDRRRRESLPCAHASIRMLDDHAIENADRLIAIERRQPFMQGSIGLFVEPGAALDAWKAKMAPVPREVLVPVPENARRAQVAVLADTHATRRVRVGDKLGLDVRVTNAGAASTWPTTDAGPYPILLGARTFVGNDTDATGEYRAAFRAPLAPNDSATVHIDVGPFRQAGAHRVSVGVVQELVAWFPDTQDITVQVSER